MELEIPHSTFRLDNGLRVVLHEDPSSPMVAVNLWYHVGSRDERPGRTGFAHLFEHLMFEGSAHVPPGTFDRLLESAGGTNNGSTTTDRTNYWETVPSNALELALWLESDRMGFLLDAITQEKLDVQRDVVKNERRQSYENRPYGLAYETVLANLYPPAHPYHHSVIGSMEHLSEATLDDVKAFFRTWYTPANASLVVAGNVAETEARRLVERWFGGLPAGPAAVHAAVAPAELDGERRVLLEDDVRLPRLYLAWVSGGHHTEEDAALEVLGAVLADGKASRLHERLVYREQVAQDVSAFQGGAELGGAFFVIATAKPGVDLPTLEAGVRAELERIARSGPDAAELDRVLAQMESGLVHALERVGGFGGRADSLNEYLVFTGDPDGAAHDLERFHAVTAERVAEAARRRLVESPAVVLSVVPRGRRELAAGEGTAPA